MKIKEIVNRPTGSSIQQEEMIYVVQSYIKEKKGIEVDINLFKNLDPNSPFFRMMGVQELNKLVKAFDKAVEHFIKKEL